MDSQDRLYVSDAFNNRVLRFDHPLTHSQSADLVLGQLDFTHRANLNCNVAGAMVNSSTICAPLGLAVDHLDRLYVVDFGNARVLRFDRPTMCNQAADLVLGQRDLNSSVAPEADRQHS